MRGLATRAALLAALVCAGPLRAHHSISVVEISTPIWVRGTVVLYDATNPHVMIALDETSEAERGQRWIIEGPNLIRLNRYGLDKDFLQPGDVIEVCGFAPKGNTKGARFIHGHLMVLADGRKQLWGPYGKLDNCVRASDAPQPWAEFLNTPLPREIWCNHYQASMPLSTLASRERVDEINGLMIEPCD